MFVAAYRSVASQRQRQRWLINVARHFGPKCCDNNLLLLFGGTKVEYLASRRLRRRQCGRKEFVFSYSMITHSSSLNYKLPSSASYFCFLLSSSLSFIVPFTEHAPLARQNLSSRQLKPSQSQAEGKGKVSCNIFAKLIQLAKQTCENCRDIEMSKCCLPCSLTLSLFRTVVCDFCGCLVQGRSAGLGRSCAAIL